MCRDHNIFLNLVINSDQVARESMLKDPKADHLLATKPFHELYALGKKRTAI